MDRRTSPVELLWDLVFVFAVTQVSTMLARDLTWPEAGRAMLLLALVWWAWSAFVWAANAEDEKSRLLRAVLLVALVAMFVAGVTLPTAFRGDAAAFVAAYALVRFLHLGVYAHASRAGNASARAIAGFATTVVVGMALLGAGAIVHGSARVALWAAAAAIDYAGPAWLTRERLRSLQRVAVSHFAERYSLFVIIVLGESIVSIGAGAVQHEITGSLLGAAVAGLVTTVALWWLYFDRTAVWAEQRLHVIDDPVLAAADAYSYLHLVLVAGVVILAVGERVAVTNAADTLPAAARLCLGAGVALYIAGYDAFRWRLGARPSWTDAIAVTAVLVVVPLSTSLRAWTVCAVVAVIAVAVCAVKTLEREPVDSPSGVS
jgi:low temperature requirement protein LtrA